MNLLNMTEEELVEDLNAKKAIAEIAHKEMLEAGDRIHERRRLIALQSQFGQISEEDIKQIREAQVLQAKAILTEESVKLN
jgi:hypothetical protein